MSVEGAMSAENQKRIGSIGQALSAPAIVPHIGAEGQVSVYTFGGTTNAVLYAMGMRLEASITPIVARVLGSSLDRSAGAIKAHITRQQEALKGCKDDGERAVIDKRIETLTARLALCTTHKQLENKPAATKH